MTDLRKAAQQALEFVQRVTAWEGGSSSISGLPDRHGTLTTLRTALEQQAEPSQWRDMVVVSLVREGIGKHKARELADHFAAQQQAEPMTEVADRFAHRMALELECVLSDGAYSNKWYKSAMQVLSEYRSAMNAIHEQHSPTFMGEPKV